MQQEHFGLTQRDPRGRLRISTIGLVAIGAVLFTFVVGTLLAIVKITNRDLKPLPTTVAASNPLAPVELASILDAEPENFTPLEPVETLVLENAPPYPIYWTVLPLELSNGETSYTIAQPEVLDAVKANFLESYVYTLFSNGLPEMAQFEQDLPRLTIDGPARLEILGTVTSYYEAGAYWRSSPPQNISIGTETIHFTADGSAVTIAAFLPPGALNREQVNIETGAILATEVSPALLLEALLRWDVNQGRWLLARQNTAYPGQG